MKKLLVLTAFITGLSVQAQTDETATIKSIYTHALTKQQGYEWLRKLTGMGGRLAGSDEATEAVKAFQKVADSLGFTTQLQEVTVPHWVRGPKEAAYYTLNGQRYEVAVRALGGSIATPAEGLTAEVVEITSFEQLDTMTDELEGRIAFYNMPMDPAFINTFFAYGSAVKQRYVGALEASKKGAVGVVARSLSSSINPYPHTGSMTYAGADQQIPACAISTLHAEQLSRDLKANPKLEFFMQMAPRELDSVVSYNLVAEIKGSEKPEEVIVIGGHIDSWDLGTGAHDDGAGCMHSLDAVWLLKELDLLPKRTLRVVFFMNEEFGLNGAKVYAQRSKEEGIDHVIAMESDAGGFTPRGISMVAPDSIITRIRKLRDYLEPYGVHEFSETGAGADISQLKSDDLVMIGLRPDSHRYFEVHHSSQDVLAQVNARELELGSATLAALIYLLDKYDIVAL
ncbi:MAG TPA: peptidase M28 family protein [Cryomorphaceae bacterium]|nr:peptidase M28 family protein [Owenweeksia sp.]MBF97647.1 peptidase M28 family protein [Owenweeksia sp.]HAD97449.1 peptidase M28 family protein [Cryomorphaceae bacterium]HBF21276.1 peptidase M28 family protein [Cryomorphaceae bacterium]HCQ14772.1 peptidase M28 family protein [Cryomorphaceae bacterium]|tara:strand:- start:288 stop:1652 length:1365 start_codon:yes stop_codon:yes gene_type:complete